jgi:sulfite exporter TauE/SafE
MNEAQILILTAASIAFTHAVLGPDHYLVFTAMGKARNWTLGRTLRVTLACGLGHVLSSVLIGLVGLLLGAQLASLVFIEGIRGNFAAWALLAFGLVYLAWGLKQAGRSHQHAHVHRHGDIVHTHEHDHRTDHAHVHDTNKRGITPWILFIVFVLGPCEALIPLLMYPASQHDTWLVLTVAIVFGTVTLLTMMLGVTVTMLGLERLRIPGLRRYAHAIAGASIVVCGGAIGFLGL